MLTIMRLTVQRPDLVQTWSTSPGPPLLLQQRAAGGAHGGLLQVKGKGVRFGTHSLFSPPVCAGSWFLAVGAARENEIEIYQVVTVFHLFLFLYIICIYIIECMFYCLKH